MTSNRRLANILQGADDSEEMRDFDVGALSKRFSSMDESELRSLIKRVRILQLDSVIERHVRLEGEYSEQQHSMHVDAEARQSIKTEVPQPQDARTVSSAASSDTVPWWVDRARVIPLRLTPDERRLLRILDRTLFTSEYTDKVDVYTRNSSPNATIEKELLSTCSIVSGLVVAQGLMKKSQTKLKTSSPPDFSKSTENMFGEASQIHTELCQRVFEIGRRYKMMNPDRMRDYGKLMWILQDTRRIGKNDIFISKVLTIQDYLKRNSLGAAEPDHRIESNDSVSRPATAPSNSEADTYALLRTPEFRTLIESSNPEERSAALSSLTALYPGIDVNLVAESVKDAAALQEQLYGPVKTMLHYLEKYFHPKEDQQNRVDPRLTSLAITSGREGSRLTHNHARQYQFVYQSLKLWKEVLSVFLPIWHYAESDLLNAETGYRLCDTGQGLNRLQSCPKVSNAMHRILDKVQTQLGGWVGSSAIHLGDHNVPNALVFIDKYSQIPRILRPLAHCLNQLDKEYERWGPTVQEYIDRTFGGVENAKKLICADFFRHGFNGSGADNFFDAGSCIDGRLTSAWNWCSLIEKKSFCPLFLLTGFVGFDGEQGW